MKSEKGASWDIFIYIVTAVEALGTYTAGMTGRTKNTDSVQYAERASRGRHGKTSF